MDDLQEMIERDRAQDALVYADKQLQKEGLPENERKDLIEQARSAASVILHSGSYWRKHVILALEKYNDDPKLAKYWQEKLANDPDWQEKPRTGK